MNLKRLTHVLFPYMLLLVLVLATIGTLLWEEPIAWLQQFLALERYWWSLIVYTLAMTSATVVAPLTVAVTVPFMAKIFGPLAIFIVTWVSWMIGSVIVFFITRHYGKPLAERLFSIEKIDAVQQKMPKHLDFWVLLLLRTFIPVDVLSYAVGLFSAISFRKYCMATAVGIVPMAFILSYGPEAITGDSQLLLFAFLFVAFAILAAMAVFWLARYKQPVVKIYTHNGQFHTDDVFAVAMIQLTLDQQRRRCEIVRTRDDAVLEQAKQDAKDGKEVFVVDVGTEYDPEYNLFDHHQIEGAGERENNIPYASVGLVWQKFGPRLVEEHSTENIADIVAKVDSDFVQAVDAPDNGIDLFLVNDRGIAPITMHNIIETYYARANKFDSAGLDADFNLAVAWAKQLMPKIITKAVSQVEKDKLAGQIYADATDKRVMLSEQYVGRNHFVRFEDVLLTVSPRSDDVNGEWGIGVVPVSQHAMGGRVSFPRSWWGLRDKELQDISGVSGAKFVHRSGDFMAVANSRRSAMAMVEQVIEQLEAK